MSCLISLSHSSSRYRSTDSKDLNNGFASSFLAFVSSRFVFLSYAQCWWDAPTEPCLIWICVCLFQSVYKCLCVKERDIDSPSLCDAMPLKYPVIPTENGSLWYLLIQATCWWQSIPKCIQWHRRWSLIGIQIWVRIV